MKPFVKITTVVLAVLFLLGASLAWLDVLTHENILVNPELKSATGSLMTGLMFLALGLRGWRRRKRDNSE